MYAIRIENSLARRLNDQDPHHVPKHFRKLCLGRERADQTCRCFKILALLRQAYKYLPRRQPCPVPYQAVVLDHVANTGRNAPGIRRPEA